uniref:LRRCT domain-containing protein n=1 Tax=Periophthalmus magnuspinnatus TaxID=409849 RepID=A0A3B3ZBD8_9GOBI
MYVFVFFVFLGILLCGPGQCLDCPLGCECFALTRTVKCISADLLTLPRSIPGYARTIIITGNNLQRIESDSFTELDNVTNIILNNNGFSALINLCFLDLSGNQLALLHPEALSIPGSPLQELNLSRALYNTSALTDLTTALRWGGLRGLLRLDLSGNNLALHLELLDLGNNAFRTFREDALQELGRLGDIRMLLGDNPYSCSCEIRAFVSWLNDSKADIDVESVRCASPKKLLNVTDLSLQTSYVFLGLVLGFVGMVFLFVLYLNRKGMKKWIIEMRDACRDVLEGYHYRYEIDTDPRRTSGSISAESGSTRVPGHFGLSQQLPSDTCIDQEPTDTQVKKVTSSPAVNICKRNIMC